jgi:hypothetical protein
MLAPSTIEHLHTEFGTKETGARDTGASPNCQCSHYLNAKVKYAAVKLNVDKILNICSFTGSIIGNAVLLKPLKVLKKHYSA